MGFNKFTREFFCVWKPRSQYDWVDKMEFSADGSLILFDRDDDEPAYSIDLYNSTYIKLKQDKPINSYFK